MNIALSLLWMMSMPPTPELGPSVNVREYIIGIIRDIAREVEIPENIAVNLAIAESNLDPFAVGVDADGEHDLGLFQLRERYLGYFSDRFNSGSAIVVFGVASNTWVALRYLHALYEMTGTWYDALAAYNCGLECVMSDRAPVATTEYVERILDGAAQMEAGTAETQ